MIEQLSHHQESRRIRAVSNFAARARILFQCFHQTVHSEDLVLQGRTKHGNADKILNVFFILEILPSFSIVAIKEILTYPA